MYFDTPKRWILYKLMDPEKSLLPAISSSSISFLFLYLSPLFLVTHEMARCICIRVVSLNLFTSGWGSVPRLLFSALVACGKSKRHKLALPLTET